MRLPETINNERVYNATEFAKLLNISLSTLYRMEKKKVIQPNYTKTCKRKYYTHTQYLQWKKGQY